MANPVRPFVLGTVQLGLDYGIANAKGRPSDAEAFALLDAAHTAGVGTFDTARAYGAAEACIGRWLAIRGADVAIVTKTPSLAGGGRAAAAAALEHSRAALGRSRLYALLLHRASDWSDAELRQWLTMLRSSDSVDLIGVSAYDTNDIPTDDTIELVQLPGNVFNQHQIAAPRVAAMASRGVRFHVRSVFAQGLALMDPAAIPVHLSAAREPLIRFADIAREAAVSRAALAIAGVRKLLPSAELVLGAETKLQIDELAGASSEVVDDAAVSAALALGRMTPAAIFDPRHWSK